MSRLKPKLKRPPIPPKMRKEAMEKNEGNCTWEGCTKKGTICEHLTPWYICLEHKPENLEPRCTDHAKEATASQQDTFSKIRRLTGYTKAQWTGTNAHKGKIKSNPKIAARADPWGKQFKAKLAQ